MKVDSVLTQSPSSVELALSRSPKGIEKPVESGVEVATSATSIVPPQTGTAGKVGESETSRKDVTATPEGLTKVPTDPEAMKQLAERIKVFIKDNRSVVDFALDKDLKVVVTKILEQETGDVIRQFPPESMLEVMKRLRDMRGVFLNEKG